MRLAQVVQGRQNANTLSFLACSDTHYPYPGTHAYSDQIGEGLTHMGQAMGLLRDCLSIDFAAFLGDTVYSGGETNEQALAAMRFVSACLAKGFYGIPNFRMRGNYENLHTDDGPTSAQIFANIGIYNRGAVYDPNNKESGYCYRDFEEFKLRVVLINTNESRTGSFTVSAAQCTWLAGVLDLSSKGEGWRSILLSHHPLDWSGSSANVVQTVKAARGIICAFHGHVHGFKVDTIPGTEITRIAIPNACFYRNNEYGRNGYAENNDGTEFGEETTYNKTADSAQDTAFCVVTIDLAAKKIYADHYGAGYDRVIPYDDAEVVIYSITNTLTNVTSSNAAVSIDEGASYSATLTAADGYVISSVKVTMGGTDITSSAYSGGKIEIASVAGDIVITAAAEEVSTGGNYTNQVPLSLAHESNAVYNNGLGYKDGYRISTSASNYEGSGSGFTLTGYIPYTVPATGLPKPIYVKGLNWTAESNCRLYFFSEDKKYIQSPQIIGNGTANNAMSTFFTLEQLGSDYWKLTPVAAGSTSVIVSISTSAVVNTVYIRFSLKGSGAGLIITVDEPIE